jgi:hypothetical protein
MNKQRQDHHDQSCQVVVLHSVAHVVWRPRPTEHRGGVASASAASQPWAQSRRDSTPARPRVAHRHRAQQPSDTVGK